LAYLARAEGPNLAPPRLHPAKEKTMEATIAIEMIPLYFFIITSRRKIKYDPSHT
jgi:hypothetical protein